MIFHRVERNEGNHDRCGGFVFPVFRIISVVLVLTDLKPAGSAEHNVDDPGVTEDGDDSLKGTAVYIQA